MSNYYEFIAWKLHVGILHQIKLLFDRVLLSLLVGDIPDGPFATIEDTKPLKVSTGLSGCTEDETLAPFLYQIYGERDTKEVILC